jgi:small basic protein (TIGR04137 family)
MSQHPSLRSAGKDKAHRSVLKRYERIKQLKEKEKWTDEDSVYGLPKVKIIKYKVKKEKAVVAEGAEGAAAAPGAEGAKPAAGAQPGKTAGAPAKAAPAKDSKAAGGDAKKPAK